ncbi:MOSC domain-containing protein [Calidithermus chliarophilus]|uniref:MOSC domain-containing protein n=1 Tax=Calidithermus chliarophilus TaxID=52023 RepID=UPI0004170236|nr:MOSC domain-containing protein [Calidithermus chliarophilus]
MGRVLSLHAGPERGLPRPARESVCLVEGFGVEGDRKAGKRPDRQVLLLGQATYGFLASQGLELPHGSLGENVVLDFDPMGLEPGTRLQVGEAVLVVTLRCSPCAHLYAACPALEGLVGGRRGMLARVERGGSIRSGDPAGLILDG